VLQQDCSWFYCNGLWRNAPCPVSLAGLAAYVQGFCTIGSSDPNATNVFTDMADYMVNYEIYATNGFQNGSSYQFNLQTNANQLTNDIIRLVNSH
jgi:hypothetical protein